LELIPREKIGHHTAEARAAIERPLLDRQALHAHRLAFTHPTTGNRMEFIAPLAADIEQTLSAIKQWRTS
jgi:hypothetical protein